MPASDAALIAGAPGAAPCAEPVREGFSLPHSAASRRPLSRITLEKVAFLATVLYGGATVWFAPHPPMADLPQYAGQIALLRDLLQGQSPWESLLRINYFTPYLMGYGLALPLSFVMPVAAALKLLLTLAFYAFVYCCVVLRRHFRGDERLDWLFIAGFFGFAYVWGFFTFLLAAPLGLFFVLLADRYAHHPESGNGIRLCFAGAVLFFSHGLVFLLAFFVGVGLLLVRSRRWRNTAAALLPYVPLAALSIAYAMVSYHAESSIPSEPSDLHWSDWVSRLTLFNCVFGSWYDGKGFAFAALAGVFMMTAPWLLRSCVNRANPAAVVPFASVLFVWLAAPSQAMKIAFIDVRFALFALPFYALMFRRSQRSPGCPENGLAARACQVLLPLLCWALLAAQTANVTRFGNETRAFDDVLASVEPGQRALALVYDMSSEAARSKVAYHHYPLWYQAENKGFVDFNFAWAPSQMVRFKEDRPPAVAPDWKAVNFEWTRAEAWRYRYFFVRHSDPLPEALFSNDRCDVKLLKSVDKWSVYESAGCRPL